MGLKISAAVYSHIGHRKNNEDNFYINGLFMERDQMNKGGRYHAVNTDNSQIYAVCDGMGGAELGEEASLRSVQLLKKYQEGNDSPDSTVYLNDVIASMSDSVDEISTAQGMPSGSSGTTIAMLIVKDWYFRAVHVGDSRIYQLRQGELTRVTKDHSQVQQMVDAGELTPDEAWQHPLKNVITCHLGMPLDGEKLRPTISPRLDLAEGDRFLICSDGLSDEVHDKQIQEILMKGSSPAETTATLVHTALSRSKEMGIPSDNVTVIVIDVLGVGAKQDDTRRVRVMQAVQGVLAGLSALLVGGLGVMGYRLIKFLTK